MNIDVKVNCCVPSNEDIAKVIKLHSKELRRYLHILKSLAHTLQVRRL